MHKGHLRIKICSPSVVIQVDHQQCARFVKLRFNSRIMQVASHTAFENILKLSVTSLFSFVLSFQFHLKCYNQFTILGFREHPNNSEGKREAKLTLFLIWCKKSSFSSISLPFADWLASFWQFNFCWSCCSRRRIPWQRVSSCSSLW